LVVASVSTNNTLSFDDSVEWSSATFKLVDVSIANEYSKGVSFGTFYPFNGAPAFTAELIVALTSEQINHEHYELIELIKGFVGHSKLTKLTSLVHVGHIKLFKLSRLIVNSSSEGAQISKLIVDYVLIPCSEGARRAASKLIVDFIPMTSNPLPPPVLNGAIAPTHQSNLHVESKSKLIVICFKIFLHFCEDCGTFCVEERDEPGINSLLKRSGLIDSSASSNHWLIGLIGVIGFGLIASSASAVSLVCWHIDFVGFIGLGLIVSIIGLGLVKNPPPACQQSFLGCCKP
jgi:hypothetical protein